MPRARLLRCEEIIFRLRRARVMMPGTMDDGRWAIKAPAILHRLSSIVPNKGGASHLNVIETERLILREMSEADAAFVLEVLNDPGFIRFVGDRGVRTLEDAARYVAE